MSRRKPLAGLAAVTAALALAVPAANASAATTAPAHFSPGFLECPFLVRQLGFAGRTGNIAYVNFLGAVLLYSGCGGAAI